MLSVSRKKVISPIGNDYEVIFINNRIDDFLFFYLSLASSKKHTKVGEPAESSNINRAIKIVELIKLLDQKNLTIYTVKEEHIKELIIDFAKGEVYKKTKQKIKRNTINAKLREWFYMFLAMKDMNVNHNIVLHTTERIVISQNYSRRVKTSGRVTKREYKIETWNLFLKPDPEELFYKALSFKELEKVFSFLGEIDEVYKLMAEIMYETGLRVDAVLNIKEEDFNGYLNFLKRGINNKNSVRFSYINKGGDQKKCDLPMATIIKLNTYKNGIMRNRLKLYHKNRTKDNRIRNIENPFWITRSGLVVDYKKFSDAFKDVSENFGNKDNKITTHWMRHTFATHSLINYCKKENINLSSISIDMLDGGIIALLVDKLGHASEDTIKRYIVCATRLMNNESIIKKPWIDINEFNENIHLQLLVKEEALLYYDGRLPEGFNLLEFGLEQEILIDKFLV